MNHELRTPLTSIVAAASLIESTDESALQPEMVHIIKNSSEHLLNVVNDILTLTTLEAGAGHARRTRFNLREMFTTAISACRQSYGRPFVETNIQVAADIPNHVWGDAVRVRQVLLNLLSNAFKVTERGSIQLRASWQSLGDRWLSIEVQDTGPGIPSERQAQVFEPFFQSGDLPHPRFAGTGLGLSLVKRLVHLLGGRIEVHSAPDTGTAFRWLLQVTPCELWLHGKRFGQACALCAQNETPPLWPTAEHAIRNKRMLLVEDNAINRKLVAHLLEREGYGTLTAVATGQEALRAFEDTRPDIVFLDLHLPDIDGFQVVRAMRARSRPADDPLFLALTADTGPGIREMCIAKGMHDYISKPVSMAGLRAILAKHLGVRAS